MNCPGCGLQIIAEQKFCRSCGANLQLTTQPLTDVEVSSRNTPTVNSEREKNSPNTLVLRGFILMFIGVALGVIGEKLVHADSVTVIGILLSLLGMFLTAYPYFLPASSKKYGSGSSSEPKGPRASAVPKSLPHDRETEYVPSVTERTTDLLQSSKSTIAKRKED
jgi:hypothetical protein